MASERLQTTLAANIRDKITQRGISIDAAADLAGVSRRQLYSVLSGEYDASIGWLERLAEALEVEVWELLRPRPVV